VKCDTIVVTERVPNENLKNVSGRGIELFVIGDALYLAYVERGT